jgi:hypothetical protein
MVRALARVAAVALVVGGAFTYAALHPGTSHADSLTCQTLTRGFDFDTFELENYKPQYSVAIEFAAAGKAVPAPYTLAGGETVDLRYPGLKSGPRSERVAENTQLRVPPTIVKAIDWIESNWANASGTVPYGGVGPLIVSGDCGYGIAQITSGMGQLGADAFEPGVPSARQAIIGTDFLFNIAEGVRILAAKWNSAPASRPIAGNGDPAMLEDWYYAIWSYNGFAFSNHPLNPNLDPLRGGGTAAPVYHCNDPSAPGYVPVPGGVKYGAGSYTYPERVYGCMRYPPKVSGVTASDASPKFVIGDQAVVLGTGDCLTVRQSPGVQSPRIVPAPGGCIPDGTPVTITAGPVATSGADGDYNWWQAQTPIGVGWLAEPFLAKNDQPPVVDPANRLWPPQVFNMPNLAIPAVAEAFKVQNFTACDDADSFLNGCPEMDFPTIIPDAKIAPHPDSTGAVDPGQAAQFIGSPTLQVTGPSTATLDATGGNATSVQVTVRNVGTFIAPFRVRTTADWLVARHPGDPVVRTLDGGVAIGGETQVVTQSTPRVAQAGYASVLTVTLDPSVMPGGTSTATLYVEPLLGGGSTFTMTVTATKGPDNYQFRVSVPGLAGDSAP